MKNLKINFVVEVLTILTNCENYRYFADYTLSFQSTPLKISRL